MVKSDSEGKVAAKGQDKGKGTARGDGGMDEKRAEKRGELKLAFTIFVLSLISVVILVFATKGCTGDYIEVKAEKRPDFEAIARVVKLQDGILTEKGRNERKAEETKGTDEGREESRSEELAAVDHAYVVVAESAPEAEAEAVETRENSVVMNEYELEMYARLTAYCIEWWYPYARAQMFQESRINPNAENGNGLDKGILQYRITYWPVVCEEHGYPADTSIFDWRVQIAIYVADTARRLRSGCTVEETISRHKQSDYGSYDAEYVDQVMRWAGNVEKD